MRPREASRRFLLPWTALLLGPLAWSASLGLMYSLTRTACGGGRSLLVAIGLACAALSGIGTALAWRRHAHWNGRGDDARRIEFMFGLAIGMGAIFTLVIALSIVPVFLLSPCPT